MRKLTILFLLIFITGMFQAASAQKGAMFLGIGANGVLPVGKYGEVADAGFGGTVMFMYMVQKSVALTAHSGYFYFPQKIEKIVGTSFQNEYDNSAIPVMLGVEYLFGKVNSPRPYIGGQLGIYSLRSKFKTPTNIHKDPLTGEETATILEGTDTKTNVEFGFTGVS